MEAFLPQDLLADPSPSSPPSHRASPPTSSRHHIFTTAGTVYDPDTATPIKPPVRKGRNLRFQQGPHTELPPGLPKALLASLPLRLQRSSSPTTTASSFKHYAPLRQNNQRAITPNAWDDVEPNSDFGDPSTAMRLEAGPPLGSLLGAGGAMQNEDRRRGMFSEGEIDESSEEFLATVNALAAKFNVKGLTNLASYKNPSQKAAQHALTRARAALDIAPVVPITTILPHRSTASALPYDYSDASQNGGLGPAALRQGHSVVQTQPLKDHTNEQRARIDNSIGHRPRGGHARMNGHANRFSGHNSHHFASRRNKPYNSALSSGPGAPRPLTAGPPGLRQYRPNNFESSMRALALHDAKATPAQQTEAPSRYAGVRTPVNQTPRQEAVPALNDVAPVDPQTAPIFSPIGDMLSPPREGPQQAPQQALQDAPREMEPRLTVPPPEVAQPAESHFRMRETQPVEVVAKYYHSTNMPPEYGTYMPLPIGWQGEYQMHHRGPGPMSREQLAKRQAKVDERFYAGTRALHKSIEDVITEAEKRHLFRTAGRFQLADALVLAKNATLRRDRQQPRMLTLEESLEQDRAKDAEPLINMFFAALLRRVEGSDPRKRGSKCCVMPQFGTPDPSVVDDSPTGLRSFFAVKRDELPAGTGFGV